MRTTITLDDKQVAKAISFTGIAKTSDLIRAGLDALIQREVARQLIDMGGTDPTAEAAPRRRSSL